MEQLSLDDFLSGAPSISFPLTHDDVMIFLNSYIREDETDSDLFASREIGKGYSYYIYGTKVLEHKPGNKKTASLRVREDSKYKLYKPDQTTPEQMTEIIEHLKSLKRELFLEMIPETFGCCNDYLACSDARACLHSDDRFFNGCGYRQNLEAGRIFYGKNCNTGGPEG